MHAGHMVQNSDLYEGIVMETCGNLRVVWAFTLPQRTMMSIPHTWRHTIHDNSQMIHVNLAFCAG